MKRDTGEGELNKGVQQIFVRLRHKWMQKDDLIYSESGKELE